MNEFLFILALTAACRLLFEMLIRQFRVKTTLAMCDDDLKEIEYFVLSNWIDDVNWPP